MVQVRTNNSPASQPVKAGSVPVQVHPKVSFEDAAKVATEKLDALLRGGVECITFISSAFLIGYLSRSDSKVKMGVMRDEFALMLGKKGLGGTQTKRYLDYAFKLSGMRSYARNRVFSRKWRDLGFSPRTAA